MGTFLLDKSVTVDLGTMKDRGAVRRAVERFYRDLDMVVDGGYRFWGRDQALRGIHGTGTVQDTG